jgi:transcriptional regulator with XRE-family HTH domain
MFDFSVLRQLRRQHGRTLQSLSEASGVSVAVISKMERNQSSAELETLFKLGRAFGLSATDLLAMAEMPLVHRSRQTSYRSGEFRFDKVTYANVVVLRGEASAGNSLSRPEIHRDDYELCWVHSGRLRLSLPHEIVELGAGESIQFDAVMQHTYEAIEECRFTILHLRKDKRF